MKFLRKRLLTIVIVLAIAGLLLYAFWPRPMEVDLATVSRGRLQVTVNEDGKTRIKERYVVSAPLSGKLMRITLDAGDKIAAAKSLLAVIEPSDPSLLDERARAEAEARVNAAATARKQAVPKLERAKVAHQDAVGDLGRARDLLLKRSISQEDYDDARHKELMAQEDVKAAEFAVQISQFELELAKAALVRTRPRSPGDPDGWRLDIVAPVDGVVLRLFQKSSVVVTPGTKLLEVGDPDDLEVEVDVLSSDAVKMAPGNKVYLEQWGGDAPLMARIRLVEPAGFLKISALGVEEQRVNVIMDFTEPPQKRKRLGDAYRVEARIVIWEKDDVVKVPAGALFREGSQWTVFTVVDGRAQKRAVTVGRSNGLETEVLAGLKPGDQVVLHPGDRIVEGASVVGRKEAGS